jgi:peptidoglycan hydrolase-like protein with peptidoglycan-binding domain
MAKVRMLVAQLLSRSNDLALRSSGDNVHTLQLFLAFKNIGPAALKLAHHGATQKFGPLTYAALIEYQKSVGLPATGYLGPVTRQYIAVHETQ